MYLINLSMQFIQIQRFYCCRQEEREACFEDGEHVGSVESTHVNSSSLEHGPGYHPMTSYWGSSMIKKIVINSEQ